MISQSNVEGRIFDNLMFSKPMPGTQTFQAALLVFSTVGPKQNARSLSKPVSNTAFYALSHGTLGFALHGRFFNHFLILGGNSSPANQIF